MNWAPPESQSTGKFITAAIWDSLVNAILFLKQIVDDSGNLSFQAPTQLSVSSNIAGSISPTRNVHTVDTNGGAAAGDLTTIAIAGSTRAGHLLLLSAANPARVVTVRHGLDNIQLADGQDYALDTATRNLVLLLRGTTWFEVARTGSSPFLPANPIILSRWRDVVRA